jgi:hypothetical protein
VSSAHFLASGESPINLRAPAQPGELCARISKVRSGLLRAVAQEAPMNARSGPLSMFRPVLWLAAAAFAAGFGGYLMMSPALHAG